MLTKDSFLFIIIFFMLSNFKKYKKIIFIQDFSLKQTKRKNVFFLSPLSPLSQKKVSASEGRGGKKWGQFAKTFLLAEPYDTWHHHALQRGTSKSPIKQFFIIIYLSD